MIAERASLYSILGLKELEADNETIKEAFRGKMLKWHPDKNRQNSLRQDRLATAQRIIEAYKILSNSELKRLYDLQLTAAERKTRSGHLEEIYVKASQLHPEIVLEYDCQQCQGQNSTTVRLEPFVDFVVVCGHCGLRSKLMLDCQ